MSFTQVTTTIPIQPPVGAFSMQASGTIYRGQAVYICSSNSVCVPTNDNKRLFGIAEYNVVNTNKVAIFGAGNLVACKISASSTLTAGTFVGVINGGYISNTATYKSGAVITKAATSNYGTGEILILGTEYL